MILVLAEHSVEGVPLILADAELRDIVGIATVAEVAEDRGGRKKCRDDPESSRQW